MKRLSFTLFALLAVDSSAFAKDCFVGAVFTSTATIPTKDKEAATDGKYTLAFVDGVLGPSTIRETWEKACFLALKKDPAPASIAAGATCKVSSCGSERAFLILDTMEITFAPDAGCPFLSATCKDNLLKSYFTHPSDESVRYQLGKYFTITTPNANSAAKTADTTNTQTEKIFAPGYGGYGTALPMGAGTQSQPAK